MTYWHIDGGTTPSHIYEQTPDGTIIANGTVPLDGRAIVYRPQDGNIYIRSYAAGLYRLKLPFDGTVTLLLPNIFQDAQDGFAFADGGNVFDVFNGNVREYNFNTGAVLKTFSLNPNYPSGTTYPYNVKIASDGTDLYFLSQVDNVFAYDTNGVLLAVINLNHPTLDTFNAPFSLSYTNERLYVLDSAATLYGYRIKQTQKYQYCFRLSPFSDSVEFNVSGNVIYGMHRKPFGSGDYPLIGHDARYSIVWSTGNGITSYLGIVNKGTKNGTTWVSDGKTWFSNTWTWVPCSAPAPAGSTKSSGSSNSQGAAINSGETLDI